MVDQRVSRPGPTPPPRKLHLLYRLYVTSEVRDVLAVEEYDEQPGGGHRRQLHLGLGRWVQG